MRFVIALFAFSIPFTDVSRAFLGVGSIAEVLLLPMMVAAGLVFARPGELRVPRGWVLCVVIMALSLLSTLWDGGEMHARSLKNPFDAFRMQEYCAAYLCVSILVVNDTRREWFMRGLVGGCLAAIVMAIWHWSVGPTSSIFDLWVPELASWASRDDFRVSGSFGNPLNLAAYMSALLGIAVMSVAQESRLARRVFWTMLTLAMAVILLTTGSKIVLFVMFVAVAFARRPSIVVLVAVATTMMMMILDVSRVLVARLEDRDESVEGRWNAYGATLEMIGDHPLAGVGPGRFEERYDVMYRRWRASADPTTFTGENLFLEVTAELGVPCGAVFALLVLRGVRVRRRADSPGIVSRNLERVKVGLACYLVVGMIQSAGSADISLLLFGLLGVQEAQRLVARREMSALPAIGARAHAFRVS